MKSVMILALLLILGCQKKEEANNTLWIYTSMYKDTISKLTPLLKKDFPGVDFKFYQAGSEDIATKVNAEIMANNVQADILISSDRFWYEELSDNNYLHSFTPNKSNEIDPSLKHPESYYHTVSIPVMVLAYNNEVISKEDAPKSFKELSTPEWNQKFTTGSPLSSGTNFTTMAMLQYHYGWDYFKKLKNNQTIAQGGNSSVLRRIQSKERPVGWVLLENLLRFQDKDNRLEIIYPEDGVVTHSNVMAITKKKGKRELAQKFVNWMYEKKGQKAMTDSFMYSPLASFEAPKGAPSFNKLLKNSFKWDQKFIKDVTAKRSELKEKYTEIMFQ